jgi:hypothetical protein
MQVMRIVFLSALGLVAGCGGCDSCFSKPSAEDDAAVPARAATAAPLAVADASEAAAPADEKSDAGSEAGTEAVPVPRASSLPRPKGPMPMGSFQSCGRYDGPLCEKTCPKGNCRQECDGVDCLLTCEKGYCSQMCGASAKCTMTCQGGHCVQACTKPEGCVKSCAGGSCE